MDFESAQKDNFVRQPPQSPDVAPWLKTAPGARPYDAEFESGLELILDALERLSGR